MSARRCRVLFNALLVFAAGLTVTPQLRAGAPHDTTYSLVAYVGGGYSRYVAALGGPPAGVPVDFTKSGLAGTARVMWWPDHLIHLGIETGWTSFYSYKFGSQYEGQESVSAVPVIIVWSMNVLKVDVFAGAGYYLLNSNLDYHGTVNVQTWSLGWLAAASYTHKFSDNWGVAGEIKWQYAAEHQDAALTFQVQMVWKFLEW
jgi:hypothetical protein